MVNKPKDYEPNDGAALIPTKVIQTKPTGNIPGSLTTIAQEGGFGAIDTSNRSMLYLYPSMTFSSNRLGAHEFRGGAELYPYIANETSRDDRAGRVLLPSAGHHRRRPTCCSSATRSAARRRGTTVDNKAYEQHYAGYFQDRWKPTSQHLDQGGRARRDQQHLHPGPAEGARARCFPPGLPTDTADRSSIRWVDMPNFGIAYNAGRWGVFRGTARPRVTSGSTWAAATARRTRRTCWRPTSFRANPRTQRRSSTRRCPAAFRSA